MDYVVLAFLTVPWSICQNTRSMFDGELLPFNITYLVELEQISPNDYNSLQSKLGNAFMAKYLIHRVIFIAACQILYNSL